MKIIANKPSMEMREVYNLTHTREAIKMMQLAGNDVNIVSWAVYEDVDKRSGEVYTVVSIKLEDGRVCATNSKTFVEAFCDMVEMIGDIESLAIRSAKSKSNREFLYCEFIN